MTGGTRGAGMTALAKVLAVCAGTVGGAAACVATGVVPAPLLVQPAPARPGRAEGVAPPPAARPSTSPPPAAPTTEYETELPDRIRTGGGTRTPAAGNRGARRPDQAEPENHEEPAPPKKAPPRSSAERKRRDRITREPAAGAGRSRRALRPRGPVLLVRPRRERAAPLPESSVREPRPPSGGDRAALVLVGALAPALGGREGRLSGAGLRAGDGLTGTPTPRFRSPGTRTGRDRK